MCKCVLYYCHRVSTQLQLTKIGWSVMVAVLLVVVGPVYLNCTMMRGLANFKSKHTFYVHHLSFLKMCQL